MDSKEQYKIQMNDSKSNSWCGVASMRIYLLFFLAFTPVSDPLMVDD